MKELLVNIKIAKLLKEIKYEPEAIHHVTEGKSIYDLEEAISKFAVYYKPELIIVPTFEEAAEWLRSNYNIYITIRPMVVKVNYLRFDVFVYNYKERYSNPLYISYFVGNLYTYEDAYNVGLRSAILTIINNKNENTKA